MQKYAIGIDFGSESGRAHLVSVSDGREIATCVHAYPNGVMDERLPEGGPGLEPDWALQDPADYLEVFKTAVPGVIQASGIDPNDVIGIGVDFTACTILPTTADGTPLCFLSQWRSNPHAWVKLWKHHAAQPEADQINHIALEMGEPWVERYGGKISSEWFFPKVLQILNEAPEVYDAADRLIEAADWAVWQLTGREPRSACTAGYKGLWSKQSGFPSNRFLAKLHPKLEFVVDEKMSRTILPIGAKAGELTAEAAEWTGLPAGTAVAVGIIDAHAAVPAATVAEPGRMVMIMGTSTCHMVLTKEECFVPGISGSVEDGIIPGMIGYEAGQSCVGDHFAWFIEHCVPEAYQQEARSLGITIHEHLEAKAAALKPGESGLLALDWWNGNRCVLQDADLTGVILGVTLQTKPEEIYRALIEATAYGTRIIIEQFVENGVAVDELIAAGGLPERNKLMMQIYADVTGRTLRIAGSSQATALGAAMLGAVAAGRERGGFDSIFDAAPVMGKIKDEAYHPNPEAQQIYQTLFEEYIKLHDFFGRGGTHVMKRLKTLRAEQKMNR